MAKIKSMDELMAIRNKLKDNMEIRSESESNIKVIVGMATCGIAAGARSTFNALVEASRQQELKNITFVQAGCMGACYAEPTVEVQAPGQDAILYGNVNEEKAKEIVEKHLKNGELVQNLIIGKPFENVKA